MLYFRQFARGGKAMRRGQRHKRATITSDSSYDEEGEEDSETTLHRARDTDEYDALGCYLHAIGRIPLLSAEQEYNRLHNYPDAPAHELLTQFVTLHHAIEAQDYEHMGAYAEAIVAEGKEEADKRFPLLAEHISKCPSCQSTLEETVASRRAVTST